MPRVYVKSVSSSEWSRTVWDSATSYSVGDRVSYDDGNGNKYYECIQTHSSSAPQIDGDTYWARIGSSPEFPYHAADGRLDNYTVGDVYLESINARYKGSAGVIWKHATNSGSTPGEIILEDGEYFQPSSALCADGIDFTAVNTGKVTINHFYFGSIYILTADHYRSKITGINLIMGGHSSAKIVGINAKIFFDQCKLTDENCPYGPVNDNDFRIGNGNHISFKDTLLYFPNAIAPLSAGSMQQYEGNLPLWENSTFAINIGNGNNYSPFFYNSSTVYIKNCIFYAISSNYTTTSPISIGGQGESNIFYTPSNSTTFIDNSNFLFLDPGFIDPSEGNFSLRPSSPLIGGIQKDLPLERNYPNAIWFDSNSTPTFQTYNFSLDSGDGNNYTFSGDATGADPAISAETGDVLTFVNNTGGHPLEIQDADGNSIATESGGSLTFSTLRPGEYTYICQAHPDMSNTITITANVGLSKNPTNSFKSAVDAIYSNDNVIIVKNGTHTLVQSETGGSTTTSTLSLSGTANKLTIIGESTDKAILIANGASWGTAFNAYGTNISLRLESLTLENHRDAHYGVITGGNNTSVEIESCKLLLAPSISSNSNGWFTGDAIPDSSLIIKNSIVECGGGSGKGSLAGGGSEDNYNVFELVGNTFLIKTGTSTYLIDNNVGADLSSFIFKNNIFVGLSGNETIGFTTTMRSSAALTIKNNCYYNTAIDSSNALDSEGALFDEPKFLDAANGDYRLRPSSPCIGGSQNFKNTSNVYYLQPGNPYNGDGSQKDASSMSANGDPGPFNEFKEVVAAGVPYGSTIIIVNGTYDWTLSFGRRPSTDVATNTWSSYTCAGYNYVAETPHEVIFDAKMLPSNVFIYKPYGGPVPGPSTGTFLDLDTTFTGVQFNNMTGYDNITGNMIGSVSGSAGQGSCTFKNCKFLGHIFTLNSTFGFSWTGGGRNKYSSTMHWENCDISIAFDYASGLLSGTSGYADDSYHGAWSWKNCTFYIPTGLTTFNGRNAANGTYVSPSLIFGTQESQNQREFKNNIIHIPNGTTSIGVNSSNNLPKIENNCLNGVSSVYSSTDHTETLNANNNLLGVDPKFVDSDDFNFSLRPNSPLIGKGL